MWSGIMIYKDLFFSYWDISMIFEIQNFYIYAAILFQQED